MESSVSVVYVESNHMSQRKRTVIDILRESPGFVSGEVISARLGISRNAVHKHVKSLRKRGYQILGISRRGYKLEAEPVKLVVPVITEMTQGSMFGRSFRYYDEIESTNVEAKELARAGAPEGTVVIAELQLAGRGRLGRRWTSPAGKGLLFSVILRPTLPMSRAHMLTIVAAVAAARGIETQTDAAVRIKWPNDLFVGDRKAGGILLEVAGEQDVVEWVIVGIGINVNTEYAELPVDLRRTAISLKMATGDPVDRSELLARILLALETAYKEAQKHGFDRALSEFRQRDYLLKRSVSVQTREGSVIGEATGIDNQGALLVQLPHRHVRRFHSGDVTLH
ncbi:MAG: biotin--[acetyl-CoA-carboxylase] ligase [Actinomycetota bacterium]|nr:MAG: biotin--[acetyl-CoA-carboxylase] ligase [Actinomycetota bacterium]